MEGHVFELLSRKKQEIFIYIILGVSILSSFFLIKILGTMQGYFVIEVIRVLFVVMAFIVLWYSYDTHRYVRKVEINSEQRERSVHVLCFGMIAVAFFYALHLYYVTRHQTMNQNLAIIFENLGRVPKASSSWFGCGMLFNKKSGNG